ncbi:MAG: 1-acyl-sn-glycerol-3-phosphate acyltransferase [Hyphomicrobiales bacterium]|nr:MAG: 1-acyl-sn-glycerol-3-phosphate acyltransferase [Hyphomicrobiales bacterium]
MIALRSVIFNIALYAYLIGAMLVIWPVFLLPRKVGWPAIRWWAFTNLWLLRHIARIDIEVRGRENIPQGGFIVASKHQSMWETFALIPLFRDPVFIFKRELMWIPLFGWYAWKFHMIPVNRGRGSAVLPVLTTRAREAISEGRQLLIFPEGTRRPAGAPPAYKFGVAHLYKEIGCPVLPVALNSGAYWPRRKFLRFPGTIVIEILPAIEPGVPTSQFREILTDRIEDASDRLLLEAAESNPAPPLSEMARQHLDEKFGPAQ